MTEPAPMPGSIAYVQAAAATKAADTAQANYNGPSSQAILDVIEADELSGIARGRGLYVAGKAKGYGVPLATIQYADELKTSLAAATPRTEFQHPRAGAMSIGQLTPGGNTEQPALSQSDIAWLNALPADPENMSYDDAQHLAALHKQMSGLQAHNADRRLIEQRWAPVEEVYDRREAQHHLAHATKPLTQLPNPVSAVAAVLGIEMPNLSESELFAVAEQRVNAAFEARQTRHANRLAKAQQRMTTINERKTQRTSTTRGTGK